MTRRRFAFRTVAIIGTLAVLRSPALHAQGSLVERWIVDFVGSSWRPLWMNLSAPVTSLPDSEPPRLVFGSQVEFLSLGSSARLAQRVTTLRARQQVGRSRHTLVAGVAQDGRSVHTSADDPLLRSTATPVADLGLELRWPATVLGDLTVLGVASMDRGLTGSWVLGHASPFHSIRASGWRVNARPLMLTVPTDSVIHVAEEHVVDGKRLEASLTIPLASIRPSAEISYEKGEATNESVEREAFLTLSPDGQLEALDVRVAVELRGTSGLAVQRRWQKIDLSAPFMRSGQTAGKMFFGRLDFQRWAVEGWHETPEHRWSWFFGVDALESAVSARVETWPFVALWEQLGATAFRYRGSMSGDVFWLRLARRGTVKNPESFAWAVNVGIYELDTSRQDWIVTSLGLGRAEEDSVATWVRPAILLGGEVGKQFRLAPGHIRVFLAADLPVYGRSERSGESPTEPQPPDEGGLAGQFRLGVAWLW